MEVADKDKKAVTELKVANMMDTGVLSGPENSASLDIDKDGERFFVRIPGGAALKNVSIKIGTVDNPDNTYNDDATEIDMLVDGNDLITKSLLLVSDDVDDDYAGNGIGADDAKNDRTHKVQLGGKVEVKSITIDGTEHQINMKTEVPVKKTVTVSVVVLRDKSQASGGKPVVTNQVVESEMKEAAESFSQAGIRLKWSTVIKDPPAGVDLSDGLTEFLNPATPTAEELALINGLGTASTNDIHIFYVNKFTPVPPALHGSFGEAFLESISGAPSGENVIVNAFGSANVHFNVPHELGHILQDFGGHPSNTYQLMRGGGTSVNNVLGGSKRFTKAEINKMLNSKHSK